MRNKVLWLTVFGLAMAYVEAAVVVYLREIVYPGGFAFPLRAISLRLGLVEVAREAATIFMLLAAAHLAQRTRRGRFACFLFLFGLWDIGYYLWLWVAIGWPQSAFTWDVLFLIPLVWSGPVLAPMLVSCVFVLAGLLYHLRPGAAEGVVIGRLDWLLTAASAVIIFAAFVFNHAAVSAGGLPGRFPWEIFLPGLALAAYLLAKTAIKTGSGPEMHSA
jgi:hypothetical protein